MNRVEETGEVLAVTPAGLSEKPSEDLRFVIPNRSKRYKFDDPLVASQPLF